MLVQTLLEVEMPQPNIYPDPDPDPAAVYAFARPSSAWTTRLAVSEGGLPHWNMDFSIKKNLRD